MTVTTESQATVPAFLVEQGDIVFARSTGEWEYVRGVRHTQSVVAGWQVTLEIGERDYIVLNPQAPVLVVVNEYATS